MQGNPEAAPLLVTVGDSFGHPQSRRWHAGETEKRQGLTAWNGVGRFRAIGPVHLMEPAHKIPRVFRGVLGQWADWAGFVRGETGASGNNLKQQAGRLSPVRRGPARIRLLAAVSQGQNGVANVFGESRPELDKPRQFGGQFGPVCATSVQPRGRVGWKRLWNNKLWRVTIGFWFSLSRFESWPGNLMTGDARRYNPLTWRVAFFLGQPCPPSPSVPADAMGCPWLHMACATPVQPKPSPSIPVAPNWAVGETPSLTVGRKHGSLTNADGRYKPW
jgi:hypothetical protein